MPKNYYNKKLTQGRIKKRELLTTRCRFCIRRFALQPIKSSLLRHTPGGSGKANGGQVSGGRDNHVPDLGARQRSVAEVVIAVDEFVPEAGIFFGDNAL